MEPVRLDIVTALPGIVEGPLGHSILRRAADKGLVRIRVFDIRSFATDKHRQIDDYPYGGGAGMVLKPEPITACIEAIKAEAESGGKPVDDVIYLTPDGQVFDQSIASELSLRGHLILLAGHYKGVDQRVRDLHVTREISIGDYVLSGGELPALVLVDAIVRLIPGVLGDAMSALSDSFMDGLLDAPAFTRPVEFRGLRVPDVLLSGDHVRVDQWRDEERYKKTKERRPDLLAGDGSDS
jgi:tRNA (guanine37-N1)-methyltransferase